MLLDYLPYYIIHRSQVTQQWKHQSGANGSHGTSCKSKKVVVFLGTFNP